MGRELPRTSRLLIPACEKYVEALLAAGRLREAADVAKEALADLTDAVNEGAATTAVNKAIGDLETLVDLIDEKMKQAVMPVRIKKFFFSTDVRSRLR